MFDLSIEKLKEEENLSVRSYNVLKQNGFFFLSQLIAHFQNHGTFINFRNCGLRSQEELYFICKKYENHFQDKGIDVSNYGTTKVYRPDIRFIRIKSSASFFRLKPKTETFLKKNGFVFVKDVCDHYERCKSFKTLPSCTEGINAELILFTKKFKLAAPMPAELPKEDVLESLDLAKYSLIEQWFCTEYDMLSIRTRNVLERFIGSEIDLKSYYKQCIEEEVDFLQLRNAGERTVVEITDFNQRLQIQIANVKSSVNSADGKYIVFAKMLSNSRGLPYDKLLKYESQFHEKKFPIFEVFLNLYIATLNLKPTYQVVLKYLLYKEYEGLQFSEIGEVVGLSAERIRQLKIKLLPIVLHFFEFDRETAQIISDHSSYFQTNNECVYLNRLRQYYFEDEIVSIQDEILYKSLGVLFRHSHFLYIHESGKDNNAFLISKEMQEDFDFEKFIHDLDQKLQIKRTVDELLNFEGYIYKFITNFNLERFYRIKKVCESIIEQGYDLLITFDNDILLPRNSNKSITELIYESLHRLGKPSHLNEILEDLNCTYPGREFSDYSIRSNIFRIPGVISFSRTSTYGLKEWEKEKGVRGGTIKDIVKEFLLKSSEPRHILEIEEYVLNFRDTHERNIITNLKADPEKQFVFFPSNIVGLSCKNYNSSKLNFNKLPNRAPRVLTKYLGSKKVSENEMEAITMKLFKVNVYQARYWIRQHKLKGTFAKNLINS